MFGMLRQDPPAARDTVAARVLCWASVLLGMIWACWHLPLFFMSGTTTTGQSFPLYFLQVTAISVALAVRPRYLV